MILLALLALAQDPEVKIEPAKDAGFARIIATSKIYEVSSDATPEVAKEVVKILENLHQAFVTEFKIETDTIDVPLHVSFYASDTAFRKEQPQAPPMMGGFYESGSKRLYCEMQQPDGGDWRMVLRHEGTHQLLGLRLDIGNRGPGQGSSVWFNEGFASYWATAKWDGKKVISGATHAYLLKRYREMEKAKELLPIRELVEGRQGPQMQLIYAQGWALCHFLRHGKYKDKFGAYVESERQGKISFDDFKKALGIEKVDEFEREFRKHVAGLK